MGILYVWYYQDFIVLFGRRILGAVGFIAEAGEIISLGESDIGITFMVTKI